MNKQRIKLTESELRHIIREAVEQELDEMDIDEGWVSDKWNQVKSAAKTATNNNGTMKDRFQNAKKNWNTQGELNGINNLVAKLSEFVDNGQIDPQTTVAQLIGGKYNKGRFGKMTGMAANRRGQISRRGGQAY